MTTSHLPVETVRFRALAVGFVLAMAICALTPYNNIYHQATPLGGGHFPLAPFFILIWLTVLVAILQKIFPSSSIFTGKELLIVWTFSVLTSGIAYTGLTRTFFINLTAPWHFDTVENHWAETLQPFSPQLWRPQDPEAIQLLYNGLENGRQMGLGELIAEIPWVAWVMPLCVWGAFILLAYWVMICLVNIFSRQWLHYERMNMPLLQVPMMIEEAMNQRELGRFLSDRYLIVGILIPVMLHLLNGINFYIPSIPQIPTLILAGPYFSSQGIFSAFVKLNIYIYPAFIGFAFLTSKQISFSFWFFFLLGGLLIGVLSLMGYNIPDAALGITFGPTLSRPEETQMIGAYGIFFLFILWLARHHILDVIRQSFGLKSRAEKSGNEWMSAGLSFWGLIIGSIGLYAWCVFFGMSPLTAFFFLSACFMVMVVATRVICQGGIAYFTLTAAPIDGLLSLFGARLFSGAQILLAGVAQKVLFVDLRESLMPSLLHTRRITGILPRQTGMLLTILFTLIVAIAVSFAAMLMLCYKYGIRELELEWATRTTLTTYENIQAVMADPAASASSWIMIFSIAGAAIMLVLVICYHRLYWWPIHPIGYLMAYSSAMRILWFSFFTGWLINTLCMRYGGITLFKKLRYLFIGLIIGDFLMGGLWAVIGLTGDVGYRVLPD